MERIAVTGGNRRRRQAVALVVLALVGALGLAACGDTVGYSEGTGDKIRGKELFTKSCGCCHTLADAGTTGQIGPNLDYAFVQSRIDGLGEDTILQVVRAQIAYPVTTPSTGAPGMPANILEGQDAEDVATYVASVAGLDASGKPIDPANPPKPAPPGGGDGRQGDLRLGRLRRLPHARRRRLDRHGRPEPRRREAVQGARDRPRHERPGRDAVVQGPAQRGADRRRRDVRVRERRQVIPLRGIT